ncbi:hypothetical protein [Rhizobium binxianense]
MIFLEDVERSEQEPVSMCRFHVEVAMKQMLNTLQARGWSQAELALALADAAEDHVILVASESRKIN